MRGQTLGLIFFGMMLLALVPSNAQLFGGYYPHGESGLLGYYPRVGHHFHDIISRYPPRYRGMLGHRHRYGYMPHHHYLPIY